jgi:uncharacterized protein involved in exopolysaccharide biosynthesis
MPTQTIPPEKEIIYVQTPFSDNNFQDDEIDLLELWRVVWKAKRFIITFTFTLTLAAALISFFLLLKEYKSTTTLIPARQEQSSLGGLSGLLGSLPISLPGQNGTNNIMSFLESRTLKERLISKYDLLPVLYEKLWDPEKHSWKVESSKDKPTVIKAIQEKTLENFFSISQDKMSQLITLSWSSKDPLFCQQMLSRTIEELTFFLENEYVSDSRNAREFIDDQLAQATTELEYWERQIPDKDLTLSKITRERLANQAVYTELRKQLELAKITEAKELESFKVLDKPFIPEKPFKPKKLLITALSCFSSGLIAVFFVFLRNFLQNLKSNELSRQKEEQA